MGRVANRWTVVGPVLAAVALVLAAGCASPQPSSGSNDSGTSTGGSSGSGSLAIAEKNFRFEPSTLTVKSGDVVVFENQDNTAHHVTVGDADLGEQAPGEKVTWTAGPDGTYQVLCTIHSSMTGEIVVGSGGGSGSGAPAGGGTGGTTSPGY